MRTELEIRPFGEIAVNISRPFDFRGRNKAVFINTGDVLNGKFLHHEYSEVSELPGQAKKAIRRGDILMSEIRPANGRFSYVDFDAEDYVVSTKFMVICPREDVDSKYLYVFLTSPQVLRTFQAIAEERSGTFPQITFQSVAHVPVPTPPVEEQRRLVAIVDSLDDRIELNRRMNETLEQMARALFKSWFVDFDPVRYKMEGRDPCALLTEGGLGLDPATAALFPGRLVHSPRGMIPEGWEVVPLSEEIQLTGGGTPKTSVPDYWNGPIPWFSVVDSPSLSDVWVVTTERSITERGLAESSARLLPPQTTIITARGTVGRLALTGTAMAMNQSCYGIRPCIGHGCFYTYFRIRREVAGLQQMTHGSVFDTITRRTFDSMDVSEPPAALTAQYDASVEHVMSTLLINQRQSHTLATLRDTLLPKLISGEIRIKG